ncbi:MAG: VCBS repeat-containing protein [Candidatus Eisenbacteria bacterium]|nr:VCBS repeat-containing protein [Candidatus Eisenbacteria bacterium]
MTTSTPFLSRRWFDRASGAFALALALLLPSRAHAQTTYTWIGAPGTSWSTASNWTPARTTPASNDVILFDAAITPSITVTAVPTQTIGQLKVRNSGFASLFGLTPGPATLTISGGTGEDLDVPAGNELLVNATSSNVFAIQLAAGATGRFSGNLLLSGTNGRVLATDDSSLVFDSGSQAEYTNNGTPFGATSPASVVFRSGSVYRASGAGDVFGAASPNAVVVFEAGSLYLMTNNTLPPLAGRRFADVEINSSSLSPTAATGTTPLIMDNLTLTQGTPRIQITDVRIRGDVHVTGGGINFNPTSAQTILFDGPAAQTMTRSPGGGSWSFNNNAHVQVQTPNGVNLTGGLWNTFSLTIASGSRLVVGSAPFAGLSNNGTLTVNGTLQLDPGANPPGGNPFVYNAGSALVFNQSATLTLSNTTCWPSGANAPPNVALQGGGSVVFPAPTDRTITGTLTLANGILDLAGGTLSLGSASTVAGGNAASYVRGVIGRAVGASASTLLADFPIGDAVGWAPLELSFPSIGTGGTLTVSTSAGDHTAIATSGIDAAHSVNRTWSVTNSGVVFVPASASFGFSNADLDAGSNPLTFTVRRYAGAVWSPVTTFGQSASQVSANGITAFGDFQVGTPVTLCVPEPSFVRSQAPGGLNSLELVSGDINLDGRPDLVTGDFSASGTRTVLAGDGAGGFTALPSALSSLPPNSLELGDWNGDTWPDLIEANYDNHTVSVFAGNGTSFSNPPVVISAGAGSRPPMARLARFDGDSLGDLFIVRHDLSDGAVRLGAGGLAFGALLPTPAGLTPATGTVGDLNGDGNQDAVLVNAAWVYPGSTVSVLLGDGTGHFLLSSTPAVGATGHGERYAEIADVTGDGKPDLVLAQPTVDSLSILPGDGAGGFGPIIRLSTGTYARRFAIGDVNADGRPDLVCANLNSSSLSVFLADCAGGFAPRMDLPTIGEPFDVVIGDFNSDGVNDIVASLTGSPLVSLNVFLNALAAPADSIVQFAGVTNVALGGATLDVVNDSLFVVRNIGSSGEDGVSFETEDPGTPRGVVFASGGLDLDPALDAGGQVNVEVSGSAAGESAALGAVQVDVTASGLDLQVDFSGAGATDQVVELYDGDQLVHTCVVPNGSVLHRDSPLPNAPTGSAGALAAGDGIGGVEVGLKKKSGSGLVAIIRFKSLRSTTVGFGALGTSGGLAAATTVGADRAEVRAYVPKLPIRADKTSVRAKSPSETSHLYELGMARQPRFQSDTTGKAVGLTADARGGATVHSEGDTWRADGIGASGHDGVDCDLTRANGADHRFAAGSGFQTARDAGAELVHSLRASVGCEPDSLVGTLTEACFADSITVRSDFSRLGATQVRIELRSAGEVVHDGIYSAGQSVRVVPPPVGPGQSATAASINTTRSNIKDKCSITAGPSRKPSLGIAWARFSAGAAPSTGARSVNSPPSDYRLAIGASSYSADEAIFEPVGGVGVDRLTRADFRQKNPGVSALDTLRFERPGLSIGESDFSARGLGRAQVMSPGAGRIVLHQEDVTGALRDSKLSVTSNKPRPAISIHASGVGDGHTTPPGASAKAVAVGKDGAGGAKETAKVSFDRTSDGFRIKPSAGAGPGPGLKASGASDHRLQVFLGTSLVADVVGPAPELTVANFPDRIGGLAASAAIEAVWDAPQTVSVDGGASLTGDCVRIGPAVISEPLASLSELLLETTDINSLELTEAMGTSVTGVGAPVTNARVAMAVLRNPSVGSAPVNFQIELPASQRAKVELFDVSGRRLATLHDGMLPAGVSRFTWDPRSAGSLSGLLFVKLETPGAIRTDKFVVIR